MTVVPIKSAELGRWRLAINPAVSRLWFTVDHAGSQPRLVVAVRESHSETEVDLTMMRALIELDREFSRESAGRSPDAPEPTKLPASMPNPPRTASGLPAGNAAGLEWKVLQQTGPFGQFRSGIHWLRRLAKIT